MRPKAYACFRNGFPPIDLQDKHSFYRVLSSGKVGLLLFLQKMVATRKKRQGLHRYKSFDEVRQLLDYYYSVP